MVYSQLKEPRAYMYAISKLNIMPNLSTYSAKNRLCSKPLQVLPIHDVVFAIPVSISADTTPMTVATCIDSTIIVPTSLSLLIVRKPSNTQIIRIIAIQSSPHATQRTSTQNVKEGIPSMASSTWSPRSSNTVHIEFLNLKQRTKNTWIAEPLQPGGFWCIREMIILPPVEIIRMKALWNETQLNLHTRPRQPSEVLLDSWILEWCTDQ